MLRLVLKKGLVCPTVCGVKANLVIRAAAGLARWHAGSQLAAFRRGLPRAAEVQERVRRELVAASADSRFGRDFGLAAIRDYADFARQLPILDYDRLSPYIEPIKHGDVASLFNPGTRVRMLALTSGTTGAAKYIPVTDRYLASYRRAWNAWGIALYDAHPRAWLRPTRGRPRPAGGGSSRPRRRRNRRPTGRRGTRSWRST